jgi:hypothetical protein
MSEDLKRRVKEALERTDIMALSTIGTDGPWTAPVQYRYNEKLDLFFVNIQAPGLGVAASNRGLRSSVGRGVAVMGERGFRDDCGL